MRDLNEAYEILSDTQMRAQYDAQRKRQSTDDFDFTDEAMQSA